MTGTITILLFIFIGPSFYFFNKIEWQTCRYIKKGYFPKEDNQVT